MAAVAVCLRVDDEAAQSDQFWVYLVALGNGVDTMDWGDFSQEQGTTTPWQHSILSFETLISLLLMSGFECNGDVATTASSFTTSGGVRSATL
jgi:hypothetical protein